ncbi:MAG: hypothetical protein K2M36_04425 [Clostridia bacterium]|nr:hypothetical protein [Clostridia bacterium]
MNKKREVSENTKTAAVENGVTVKEDNKISAVSKLSLIWTVISTVYAIFSTCLFIARGWVSNTVSYVLVGVLVLYVAVFILLIVLTVRNPRYGKRNVGLYKKLLKIFKAIANIAFLVLTAISLAGMTVVGMQGMMKWILFCLSFAVALVQLGLKVVLLAMKIGRMYVAKRFKVEIVQFVDGKKKRKSLRARLQENKYKEK